MEKNQKTSIDGIPPKIPLRRTIMRTVLALILVPLICVPLSLLIRLLSDGTSANGYNSLPPEIQGLYFYLFVFIGFLSVLIIFGLPVHLILYRLAWRKWWQYVLAAGAAQGSSIFIVMAGKWSYGHVIVSFLIFAIISFSFWAIAARPWKRDFAE